jgi:hypothetical protein
MSHNRMFWGLALIASLASVIVVPSRPAEASEPLSTAPAGDTSATERVYTVQDGDTPVGIAEKSGVKAERPNWWAELKRANPRMPTKDDGRNFEYLFTGNQLRIPEQWPSSAMFR